MEEQSQEVGLLGGSFNPVHYGHLAIARSFLNSDYISRLWILLTADPPHKEGTLQLPFDMRLKMLRKAFEGVDKVSVSSVEKDLPPPSYTVRTLEYLSSQYPDKRFWLCLGEDSVKNFNQWYKWEEILDYCELLVARRPSVKDLILDKKIAEKAHFIPHEPIEISSTNIRERVKKGKDVSHLVPRDVHKIIQEYNLYKQKL